MKMKKVIRPVNSLIFITDKAGADAPEWQPNVQVLFNENCIAVACYPEQDGATEIVLGAVADVDPGSPAQFDGILNTPGRAAKVSGIAGEVFLEMDALSTRTRVRIWLNHPRWADKVVIGLEREAE